MFLIRFNDGELVPSGLITDLVLQIEKQFGAVSSETQRIHGRWRNEGEQYLDELVRIFVDVPDTAETRQFFIEFKEILKRELERIYFSCIAYPQCRKNAAASLLVI